ncbi:MAG TPA: hypothetical protein VF278_22725 [Pirellulales bacterium]
MLLWISIAFAAFIFIARVFEGAFVVVTSFFEISEAAWEMLTLTRLAVAAAVAVLMATLLMMPKKAVTKK